MRSRFKETRMIVSLTGILVLVFFSVNGFAVISSRWFTLSFFTGQEQALITKVWTNIYPTVLPAAFAVSTILMIAYMWPVFRVFHDWKNTPPAELARRRLINAPVVLSAYSAVGWAISMGGFYYGITKYGGPVIVGQISSLLFLAFLTLNMCSVSTYYFLEFMSRRFLIPIFFLNKKVSDCEGTIVVPVKSRFVIYFYSVSLFPMFIFFSVILGMCRKYNAMDFLTPSSILLIVFVAFGAFLTHLISASYQVPLVKMKRATEMIRSGEYRVQTPVLSNDELGALGEAINEMAIGLRDKEFIKETFGRMVDPRVRDHLLNGNMALGGGIMDVTVLFADITNFTGMSEKMPPDSVVRMLNMYFELMSKCIEAENGLVNSLIGDAVMAVFGAPIPNDNHAEAATRAALSMRDAMKDLNRELADNGLPEIRFKIGINTGDVLAGNIGSQSRMKYTVIGDAVNTASRLEKMCREFEKEIILSEDTAKKLGEELSPIELSTITVRGKLQPVKIYYI